MKASERPAAAAVALSDEELGVLVSATDPPPLVLVGESQTDEAGRAEALAGLLLRGILVERGDGFLPAGPQAAVLSAAMVADEVLVIDAGGEGLRALTFLAADGRLVCQQTTAEGHAFAIVERDWALDAAADLLGLPAEAAGDEHDEPVANVAAAAWRAAFERPDVTDALDALSAPDGLVAALELADRVVALDRMRDADGDADDQLVTFIASGDADHHWWVSGDSSDRELVVRRVGSGAARRRLQDLLP